MGVRDWHENTKYNLLLIATSQKECQDDLRKYIAGRNGQPEKNGEVRNLPKEWWQGAKKLIPFFKERYFVRTDCHGRYTDKGESFCCKEPVTDRLLGWHCGGEATIGTYSTDPADDTCKMLHIDIDRHDDKGDPDSNLKYALSLYDKLSINNFNPVLLDSNGRGGYWLQVFFDRRVPASTVRAFGRWLTQDHDDYKVDQPEIFPKQDGVKEKFGNMFRLPGKHHKRDHYTKIYHGNKWLEGKDAIEELVSVVPVSPDLIPEDASQFKKPPRQVPVEPYSGDDVAPGVGRRARLPGGRGNHAYAQEYTGDLKTLDLLGIFEDHGMLVGDRDDYPAVVVCPWADEHSDGREQAYVWQNSDDDDNQGWPGFFCHHAHCARRALADVLEFFGPEKVDAHCRRQWDHGYSSFLEPADLDSILQPAAIIEAAEPAQDLEKYKNDPRTEYLWRGYHGRYLTDDMRRLRAQSIEEVWQYIPQDGFFPEYIKHWLPTTDAPVLFHLGSALTVAACLLHRKTHIEHGATTVKPIIWTALLAKSTKLRKSTCLNRARDTLPSDYSRVLLPEAFTVPSLLTHLGITAKTRDQLAEDLVGLLGCQRSDPSDLTGVGLLAVDELGGLLATLNMDYNHGGKQLLTTLFDGETYCTTSKTAGCVGVPNPRLNILAATTLEWLSAATKEEDIGSGFYPRWLLFFATGIDYSIAWPDSPGDATRLRECVQRLADPDGYGEKGLSQQAQEHYVAWYNRHIANASEEMGGWVHRLSIYALKVALLYEATTSNNPDISVDNVERACQLIDRITRDTATVLAEELGFSPEDTLTKLVRKLIKARKDVGWRDICRHLHRHQPKELRNAVDTLVSQGVAEEVKGPKGGSRFRWVQ
jgi:hypothetical protein